MNETEALLSQLRDVQAPPVSAMPAYGWWITAVLFFALIYLLYRCYKYYLARRWKREARDELRRLRLQADEASVAQTLADTSRLARRVLLVALPREEVASLHSEAWLEMLDKVCRKPLFSSGFGRLLEVGPYQKEPKVSANDLNALFAAMDELIAAASPPKSERASK